MTKETIIKGLKKVSGSDKDKARQFAEVIRDIIVEGLTEDGIVKVKGLGTFKVIEVKARKSVDVNTGAEIEIAAHRKVTFTAENQLADIVNEPLAHLEVIDLVDDAEPETTKTETKTEAEQKPIKEDKPAAKKPAARKKATPKKTTVEEPTAEDKAKEDKAREDKAKEDKAREDKAKEDKAREDKAREDKAKDEEAMRRLSADAESLKGILAMINGIPSEPSEPIEPEPTPQPEPTPTPEPEPATPAPPATPATPATPENPENPEPPENPATPPTPPTPATPPTPPTPPTPQPRYEQPQPTPPTSGYQPIDLGPEPPRKNAFWKVMLIVLAALLLIGGGICLYLYIDHKGKKETTVTTPAPEKTAAQKQAEMERIKEEAYEMGNDDEDTSYVYTGVKQPAVKKQPSTDDALAVVKVKEGDRLMSLSRQYYGDKMFWVYIYERNKSTMRSPNELQVGMTIVIPRLDSKLIDKENEESVQKAMQLEYKYLGK